MIERKIGDQVFVTFDNIGAPGVIIDRRESDEQPPLHYKVRIDDGQEFWAFDFEISEEIDAAAIQRVHELFMQKLAVEYPDHPWLKKEHK